MAATEMASTAILRTRLAARAPLVMGILNVTPDSFSDGGCYEARDAALKHALSMVDEGADIIDVGGESTRPGAASVSVAEELERVIPVIEAIRVETDLPISIDTSKPEVMRAAREAGANMINDVNALQADGALRVAGDTGLPVCLMHMQGTPRTMQDAPEYDDVVAEVASFLAERACACQAIGIAEGDILIDPGFGFGKTAAHNWQLIRELSALTALGYPVLVGVSRKSSIMKALAGISEDRLIGSVTAAALAVAVAVAG
jgi:dihydropteroate synthase